MLRATVTFSGPSSAINCVDLAYYFLNENGCCWLNKYRMMKEVNAETGTVDCILTGKVNKGTWTSQGMESDISEAKIDMIVI